MPTLSGFCETYSLSFLKNRLPEKALPLMTVLTASITSEEATVKGKFFPLHQLRIAAPQILGISDPF